MFLLMSCHLPPGCLSFNLQNSVQVSFPIVSLLWNLSQYELPLPLPLSSSILALIIIQYVLLKFSLYFSYIPNKTYTLQEELHNLALHCHFLKECPSHHRSSYVFELNCPKALKQIYNITCHIHLQRDIKTDVVTT